MRAVLVLPFVIVACAHETPVVIAPDTQDFDVNVSGRLAEQCGMGDAKSSFEQAKEETLASIAKCLGRGGELEGRNIRITGRGDAKYNKRLGQARAEQVATVLEGKGVGKDKIIVRSGGEARAAGKNRRVDISLAD